MSVENGWQEKRVRDLCELGRGRVISTQEIEQHPGVYPVYSSQSFNNGRMGAIDSYDFDGEYVTWTTDGAYAGTVFYRTGKFNCTNVCGTLRARDKTDMQFLAYKLGTVAKQHVSYVGNPKLMNGVVADIRLTIPQWPEEQSKIAEILSTVDRAIEETEGLIAKQQRIKTGLMQDLLTRGIDENGNLRSEQTHPYKDSPLGRIPVEWEVKPLGQICDRVTNGFVGVATPYYTDSSTGVPYLYGTNVRSGYIDFSELRYVTKSFHRKHAKSQLQPGDMLTVQSGHIGTTAVVPDGFGEANCHALIISKFKKGMVNSEFVSLFCNYCLETGQMTKLFIGSTIKHINTSEFAKFAIPFPEKEEQTRIATLVAQLKRSTEQTSADLDKLRSLKTALMHDLLTGDVRVTPLLEKERKAVTP